MTEYLPEEGRKIRINEEPGMDDPMDSRDKVNDELYSNPGNSEPEINERGSLISFIKELPLLVITAVAVAFVIKWLIVQPFYIPSQSMEPTLIPEDRVLVSKFIYRFVEPKAGDIVVFVAPNGDGRDFIKRIVATEGDVVRVKEGELFINDRPAKQDYETIPGDYSDWGPEVINKEHVFVMGDNRPNSLDSRVFGQLPEDNILGRAFIVYWPIHRVQILN